MILVLVLCQLLTVVLVSLFVLAELRLLLALWSFHCVFCLLILQVRKDSGWSLTGSAPQRGATILSLSWMVSTGLCPCGQVKKGGQVGTVLTSAPSVQLLAQGRTLIPHSMGTLRKVQ